MKFYIATIGLCCLFIASSAQDYLPIISHQIQKTDTFYQSYFIQDNYRWLENVRDDSVINWIDAQNKQSKKYLNKAKFKTNAFQAIDQYAYVQYKNPRKVGDYYFTYAYYDNHGVPALFYRTALNHDAELLVDPNFISRTDKIMLKGYSVSKDSKLLAYQFSRNGSDWAEVKVINLKQAIHREDHLVGLKFSSLQWRDDGFFYSTVHQKGEFGAISGEQIYYHKLGTTQTEDVLVFERKNNQNANFNFLTTTGERFFVIKEYDERTGKRNIFYIDYQDEKPHLKPLMMNLKQGVTIVDSHDGKFIAHTSHDSNNGSVVEIDPQNPYAWRAIAPEYSEALLLDVIPFNDRIVTIYQSNQKPIITIIDYKGEILYTLEMPIATTVGGFSGEMNDEEVLFDFSSYTIPKVVYKFNIKSFVKEPLKQTTVTFDYNNIEYKELEYTSRDGVKIPLILVYEKGLELNGNNPTILKAYGGFGIVSQPYFDPGVVYFVKKGGVFAFANIRGGGDKGKEWALAGKGENKQNSFNDFIDAAEYLIAGKYTNRNKLAITGGSNGGLVTAVAAIQRPDLFKVAVPIVAPTDMLRFENFTVGTYHRDEYGTIEDSLSFTQLLAYSPLHNIKENINYPTMLIVTSENDDRVPPLHSYKFVAALQSRECQNNPILLKVEENAGHNGANSLFTNIKEMADIYGFIEYELIKEDK